MIYFSNFDTKTNKIFGIIAAAGLALLLVTGAQAATAPALESAAPVCGEDGDGESSLPMCGEDGDGENSTPMCGGCGCEDGDHKKKEDKKEKKEDKKK